MAGLSRGRPSHFLKRESRPMKRHRYFALILSGIIGHSYAAVAQLPAAEAPNTSEVASPEKPTEYEPGRRYMGRDIAPPMHYSGAGWLTRKERVREEHPRKMLKSLELKPGQVVCDFGCGNGYHTLELAKLVGPNGQVYAMDIQPEMLDMLAERAALRGFENIKPVLATAEDPGMPPGAFDLVLMVDVYHELSHPPEVLKLVRDSLKSEGRLVLVEFREEDPAVPILPLHKMSQRQVLKELTLNGFKLVSQYDALPWQHVLTFARDDAKQTAVELRSWSKAE
jgi:ubiquinone/menaquinone biosynthesis C-methylase UbiE